jgi:RNA polymerase sigma-70 factor (ECF subfamily)
MRLMTEEIGYIRRILEGEPNLFSFFLERYSRPIYSLIIQIIPNHEDAEELTQDTFVKAFRKLGAFKNDCSFSTWLYRIAYNTAVSATRKRKIIFPVLDDSMIETIPDETIDIFFAGDDDEEMLQKLEQAIDNLNPEEKVLITLYYMDEKPINDIASILGLTPENIKVKLFRVRRKLYGWIKSKEYEAG